MGKPFPMPRPIPDWQQDQKNTSKTRIEALEKRIEKIEKLMEELMNDFNDIRFDLTRDGIIADGS